MAQKVFHLARSEFGHPFQSAIGALEPAAGARAVAHGFAGQLEEARHVVEPVRFETGKTTAAAALQAASGEVERAGQFFQGQARGLHQLSQDGVWESFANRFPQIAVTGQRPPQGVLSAQLPQNGLKFAFSGKCNSASQEPLFLVPGQRIE
jgi:hypothetical protein